VGVAAAAVPGERVVKKKITSFLRILVPPLAFNEEDCYNIPIQGILEVVRVTRRLSNYGRTG